MKQLSDLVGKKFGRLTVIEFVGVDKHRSRMWLCKCDCGGEANTTTQHLNSGHTQSCGCFNKEQCSIHNTTHGLTHVYHFEYLIWKSMRKRCSNPNDKNYASYGGRGIKVCERWSKFENFMADMGARSSPKHTLERLENNKNYCPENCVWATMKQQTRNQRTNHWIEHNGERMILQDWANHLNINSSTLIYHLRTKKFNEVVD